MTTERIDSDSWSSQEGGCGDDEDCLDGDGSGDGRGGIWDRMTTSGARTSESRHRHLHLMMH